MADTWVATIKTWAAAVLTSTALNEEIRDRMTVLGLAVDGDGSASTIKHRHLSGVLASRPAAGELGRFYYATDTKELSIDDGSAWFTPYVSILDRDLTQTENENNSGDYGHWSFEIPANELGATGGVRLTIAGDYLNNTGSDRTLQMLLSLGGTTVLDTGAMIFPANADRRKWRLVVEMMNSATDAQKWSAVLTLSPPDTSDFAIADPGNTAYGHGVGYAASAKDTTGALTLQFTTNHSVSNGSLSCRKEIAILEKLPAA